MADNIKDRLEENKKEQVNFTLDVPLIKKLRKYKQENGIISLSPMVNEMLWDWFMQQKNSNDKK